MRNRWLLPILVQFGIIVLLQVFDPMVDEILYSPWWKRWQRGPVQYAETIEVEPGADLSFLSELPPPESMIVSEEAHVHVPTHHPNDWEYGCEQYLYHKQYAESQGVQYVPSQVKPPWVPYWIVRWTELARIVPDYTEHCPDTLP